LLLIDSIRVFGVHINKFESLHYTEHVTKVCQKFLHDFNFVSLLTCNFTQNDVFSMHAMQLVITQVLSSLKQKIHLLERNLRDKEATINKLSSNLKVSRVEEAELTAETYYYEVCRLKEILQHQNSKVEDMLSLRYST